MQLDTVDHDLNEYFKYLDRKDQQEQAEQDDYYYYDDDYYDQIN